VILSDIAPSYTPSVWDKWLRKMANEFRVDAKVQHIINTYYTRYDSMYVTMNFGEDNVQSTKR
jgi:hypothetical protein